MVRDGENMTSNDRAGNIRHFGGVPVIPAWPAGQSCMKVVAVASAPTCVRILA